MSYFSWFLTAALVGMNVALVQPLVVAKSATEVERIAKAITVEINSSKGSGSGVLLQRQGDVYTVLTAAHVVEGNSAFIVITTADGLVHESPTDSIRLAANKIDMAVVKFRSKNNYTLAAINASNSLKALTPVHTAGFPGKPLKISKGKIIGVANQGDSRGRSLIYSNLVKLGMSGGPVLNETGKLVAINCRADDGGDLGRCCDDKI
jgi:S1-C subfamily serine protease